MATGSASVTVISRVLPWQRQKAPSFCALMVTDPVRGNSELLFRGLESVRRALPYRRGPDGTLMMPGVLSRKKQLLPEVIAALT